MLSCIVLSLMLNILFSWSFDCWSSITPVFTENVFVLRIVVQSVVVHIFDVFRQPTVLVPYELVFFLDGHLLHRPWSLRLWFLRKRRPLLGVGVFFLCVQLVRIIDPIYDVPYSGLDKTTIYFLKTLGFTLLELSGSTSFFVSFLSN
jgi:hypothetical protein